MSRIALHARTNMHARTCMHVRIYMHACNVFTLHAPLHYALLFYVAIDGSVLEQCDHEQVATAVGRPKRAVLVQLPQGDLF